MNNFLFITLAFSGIFSFEAMFEIFLSTDTLKWIRRRVYFKINQ